jgi:hypothetical protein
MKNAVLSASFFSFFSNSCSAVDFIWTPFPMMVVVSERSRENQTSPKENIASQATGRSNSASIVGVSEGTARRMG